MNEEFIQAALEEFQVDYDAGNGVALLNAIWFCGRYKVVMPEWVWIGFSEARFKYVHYEVETLDDAFGLNRPKGQINALKKADRLSFAVFNDVWLEKQKYRTVDVQLFAEIGEKHHIGKTLLGELYYPIRNTLFKEFK